MLAYKEVIQLLKKIWKWNQSFFPQKLKETTREKGLEWFTDNYSDLPIFKKINYFNNAVCINTFILWSTKGSRCWDTLAMRQDVRVGRTSTEMNMYGRSKGQ